MKAGRIWASIRSFISDKKDLTPERLEDLSVFLFELFASDLNVTKAQSVSVKKILRYYYKQSALGSFTQQLL